MHVKTSLEGKKTLMAVSGSIDIPGAEQLKKSLTKVLDSDSDEIIIDFEEVNFIGSSGIGKLLLFYKNFTAKGGRITIVNLNKEITMLFKAIKLDKLFNI
ncbi:MAG: anti-sigma factor antagonist [Candidatus Aminicenantes bacterium]|nr:anti-sigma factor antagonist [Candidatus Aminicenantes bacterium]NIM81213.1 anti-sigma factor antagonist [Candidatus Aminicenantes bacterium]NIN20588.1 anti-sigma factor antagonist [Candidatus Aminicenantes bacterium]NIN44367.1 anti-sigma factor antagonist [Candidatus Aminicenantes bacterium]NIN87186.1 anti-sigma factor antagonist [Candidatus Aminicenantes bacterium]